MCLSLSINRYTKVQRSVCTSISGHIKLFFYLYPHEKYNRHGRPQIFAMFFSSLGIDVVGEFARACTTNFNCLKNLHTVFHNSYTNLHSHPSPPLTCTSCDHCLTKSCSCKCDVVNPCGFELHLACWFVGLSFCSQTYWTVLQTRLQLCFCVGICKCYRCCGSQGHPIPQRWSYWSPM